MNLLFVCYSRSLFSMTGTHFYLTLPSNASSDVYPDNKIGSYRVKLPQTIDLEGNWEVGLYPITYSNTWYTLQDQPLSHVHPAADPNDPLAKIKVPCYGDQLTRVQVAGAKDLRAGCHTVKDRTDHVYPVKCANWHCKRSFLKVAYI